MYILYTYISSTMITIHACTCVLQCLLFLFSRDSCYTQSAVSVISPQDRAAAHGDVRTCADHACFDIGGRVSMIDIVGRVSMIEL